MNWYGKCIVIIMVGLFIGTTVFPCISGSLTIHNSSVTSNAKWTVMYYLCCDSEDMTKYLDPILDKLTEIGSTDDFNLIVLSDGYKDGDSRIYYINESGEKLALNNKLGWPDEIDMSNSNTLELFCTQIMNLYPADHYAFVNFASGGTGWMLYCTQDQTTGNAGVTLPVLGESLKYITNNGEKKIDVFFVSCSYAQIEIAYELSSYVNYIVGSQDCLSEEYLLPRFYEAVWNLSNNSDMTPEEFANRAPERLTPIPFYYFESYKGYLPILNQILNNLSFPKLYTVQMYDCTAVINCSRIKELTNSLDILASYLLLHIYDENIQDVIKTARKTVKDYGKCFSKYKILSPIHQRYCFECTAYDGYIDIYNFAEILKENIHNNYIKYLCNQVMERLNDTICMINKTDSDLSHGLSIYFPNTKLHYNWYPGYGTLRSQYENLEFTKNTIWDEFLKTYLNI